MFFCPWDFPDKNTGVSCHSLLQGLFPTWGLNPCLSAFQVDSLPTEPPGKPVALYASVQISCSVMSDSLRPHGLQHARLSYPSSTPRAYSNSCPSSRWCHPTISSSVIPFSSCLQSFPTPGSFPMSQLFPSCGQSIRVSASASVLPVNIQDWFPLGNHMLTFYLIRWSQQCVSLGLFTKSINIIDLRQWFWKIFFSLNQC